MLVALIMHVQPHSTISKARQDALLISYQVRMGVLMTDYFDGLHWSSTDVDPVEIPCPECGRTFSFGAWTLVNAKENPEAVQKIIDGRLCEFTCPRCGYTAHLAHPCLFVDPYKHNCIYSVIDTNMKKQAEDMLSDPSNAVAAASTC